MNFIKKWIIKIINGQLQTINSSINYKSMQIDNQISNVSLMMKDVKRELARFEKEKSKFKMEVNDFCYRGVAPQLNEAIRNQDNALNEQNQNVVRLNRVVVENNAHIRDIKAMVEFWMKNMQSDIEHSIKREIYYSIHMKEREGQQVKFENKDPRLEMIAESKNRWRNK